MPEGLTRSLATIFGIPLPNLSWVINSPVSRVTQNKLLSKTSKDIGCFKFSTKKI